MKDSGQIRHQLQIVLTVSHFGTVKRKMGISIVTYDLYGHACLTPPARRAIVCEYSLRGGGGRSGECRPQTRDGAVSVSVSVVLCYRVRILGVLGLG